MLRNALSRKVTAIVLLVGCLAWVPSAQAGPMDAFTDVGGVFEKAVTWVQDLWGSIVGTDSDPLEDSETEYVPWGDPNG
jgi:hypothetical protein